MSTLLGPCVDIQKVIANTIRNEKYYFRKFFAAFGLIEREEP